MFDFAHNIIHRHISSLYFKQHTPFLEPLLVILMFMLISRSIPTSKSLTNAAQTFDLPHTEQGDEFVSSLRCGIASGTGLTLPRSAARAVRDCDEQVSGSTFAAPLGSSLSPHFVPGCSF